MKGRVVNVVLFLFSLSLSLGITSAQLPSCSNPITECCVINEYDIFSLANNLQAKGDCIIIFTNNAALTCNGYTITGNGTGTGINISADNVAVTDCNINNFTYGISVEQTRNQNLIKRNKIFNNYRGILFNYIPGNPTPSYDNVVENNIIINNSVGILILRADRTRIHDNYFQNVINAWDSSVYTQRWNTSYSCSDSNIINGPCVGGNYWHDYTGEDLNGDGIGDTDLPYTCTIDSTRYILNGGDYLPLVDINASKYSNLTISNSTPTTFTLNITWKDNIQVDKVILELDGTNYTDAQKINETQILTPAKIEYSVTYSKTFKNLDQGTHYYRWYANDTRNNWNSTELLSFTVGGETTTTTSTTTSTTSTTTTIPEECTGPVSLTLSPNPVYANKEVTATISGLVNCDGKEAYVGTKYSTFKCCTVLNGGCSCNFSAPKPLTNGTDRTYYARVDLNGDGDYNDEGEEDIANLTILCRARGQPCSSDEPCCAGYYCSREGVCKFVGGCPILKAWDGKEFKEIEKLNIHSKEMDTTYSTSFKMEPYEKNTYKIILEEKWYLLWEGSHIDHVKLKDSTGKECKLIEAKHSKLGDVTSLIKESDDEKVEIKPGESVTLTFTECSGNDFTLEIEGYNPWWRFVKLGLSMENLPLLIVSILIAIVVIFGIFKLFRTTIRES